MKRIIVTITHRYDSIDILGQHLQKQRGSFDEWHIWLNSKDHLLYDQIAQMDCKIIQPKKSNPNDQLNNLHLFYKEDSIERDAIYLKLDDDIVWMEPEFIEKMFKYRELNEHYFIIYPNIINNAISSNLHMRFGNIPWNDRCWYNYMDSVGWGSPIFAESLHRLFLASIKNDTYQNWYFKEWNLDYKEQLSINAISWNGSDFMSFAPTIAGNDEFWINVYGPTMLNKASVIFGDMICVHYAFSPQKKYLDSTNILELYRKIAYGVQ